MRGSKDRVGSGLFKEEVGSKLTKAFLEPFCYRKGGKNDGKTEGGFMFSELG